ncbi:MAG: hypothetical protein KF901_35030 [Myxococcales bacterium]|nr:hypothetical protein [Myxococcales bacterium]
METLAAKSHARRKDAGMRTRKLALGLLVLVGLGACCLLSLGRSLLRRGMLPESVEEQAWTGLALPLGEPHAIRYEQRPIHMYFAEYERQLIVDGAPLALPDNPGGRTYINVYQHPREDERGPWLVLVDRLGISALELGAAPTIHAVCELEGRLYLVDEPGCGRARDPSGGAWELIGAHAPAPFSGYGEYVGAIDGERYPLTFRAARETPERALPPIGP